MATNYTLLVMQVAPPVPSNAATFAGGPKEDKGMGKSPLLDFPPNHTPF